MLFGVVRPERPVLSAQAEGLGKVVAEAFGPERAECERAQMTVSQVPHQSRLAFVDVSPCPIRIGTGGELVKRSSRKKVNDPRRVKFPFLPTIPGLRPGLIEPALQAE